MFDNAFSRSPNADIDDYNAIITVIIYMMPINGERRARVVIIIMQHLTDGAK